MKVLTARHVAKMVGLSEGQVRSFAREGLLDPGRGPHGEYRFSFGDLVVLRTAKGLLASSVPPRKIRSALRKVQSRLPDDRPLTGVRLAAEGNRIIVREGGTIWNPETGQTHFNFENACPANPVAPHARRAVHTTVRSSEEGSAESWCTLGADLEPAAPDHALEAYRRALDLDPDHFETRVRLGRLLQERGRLHAAETHFKLALSVRPTDSTALLHLALCLEDMGRTEEAVRTFRETIDADPECADAYYHAARLYEALGDSVAATRHLQTYRQLTETP